MILTDSKCHLYAIIQCGDALIFDKNNGLDVPLRNIPYQEIGAVVGDFIPGQSAITPENVLHHERIIEQLMHHFTLLPVRFGTILADDREVVALLAARYAAFRRNLARVANRVEVGLKVLWPGEEIRQEIEVASPQVARIRAEVDLAGPGRNYLLKRLQAQAVIEEMRQRAIDLSKTINRTLLVHAAEGTSDPLVSLYLMMSGHYLVERARVEPFRQAVAKLESEQRDPKGTFSLRFLCSGPWPPYNFIDREGEVYGEEENGRPNGTRECVRRP